MYCVWACQTARATAILLSSYCAGEETSIEITGRRLQAQANRRDCDKESRDTTHRTMSMRRQMKRLAQGKHHEWLMCLIMLLAIVMCPSTAPYYLVYFEKDKSMSVVSGNAVSVVGSVMEPEAGSLCNVRVKGNIYEGMIVTYMYGEYCVCM